MQEKQKNKYRHYGDIITADFFSGYRHTPRQSHRKHCLILELLMDIDKLIHFYQ